MLLPREGPILRPRGTNLHYEVELGLVMGKSVRDLDPEDSKGALDAIKSVFLLCPLGFGKKTILRKKKMKRVGN